MCGLYFEKKKKKTEFPNGDFLIYLMTHIPLLNKSKITTSKFRLLFLNKKRTIGNIDCINVKGNKIYAFFI